MSSIFLTGATGFLGSELLKKLLLQNHDVIIIKRSSSDLSKIKPFLHKVKIYDSGENKIEDIFNDRVIDIIIHTATIYDREHLKIASSAIIKTNILFPLRLLEIARIHNVSTFINTDTVLEKKINRYALSKNQLKEWLKYYSKTIKIINIRPDYFYGPNEKSGFVTWLIKEISSKKKVIDLTSGQQERDFIYIDDLVQAYLTIIDNIDSMNFYEEIDIGTGKKIKLINFVKMIHDKISYYKNVTVKLNFGGKKHRENEVFLLNQNLRKIKDLGWRPRTQINNGIDITLKEKLKWKKEKN